MDLSMVQGKKLGVCFSVYQYTGSVQFKKLKCKRQRIGKRFVLLQNEKILLLVDKILSSKNILWFIIQAPAQTQKLKTEDYGIPQDPGTYKLVTCTCVSTK